MGILRLMLAVMLLGSVLPAISACKKDDGNFENMEKEMHQTGDDLGKNVEDKTD